MVIANTTVISNFASVGRLDLLQRLLGQLHISTDVLAEVQDGYAQGALFYRDIERQIYPFSPDGWLHLVTLQNDQELHLFHELPGGLHRGEASSLAIAVARSWVFLTDDAKARKTAREYGVNISGTLGLLIQAVRTSIITVSVADDLLEAMIHRGFRSPRPTITELL